MAERDVVKDALDILKSGLSLPPEHGLYNIRLSDDRGFKLLQSGTIVNKPGCITKTLIFPLGYKGERQEINWVNGSIFWYTVGTAEIDGEITFVVEGPDGLKIRGLSPLATYRSFVRKLHDAEQKPLAMCSAHRFFGFSIPTVKEILFHLPGVASRKLPSRILPPPRPELQKRSLHSFGSMKTPKLVTELHSQDFFIDPKAAASKETEIRNCLRSLGFDVKYPDIPQSDTKCFINMLFPKQEEE